MLCEMCYNFFSSSLATMDQAVARIHRMNQLKETYIHTVVIKDTIEESLMDNILDKKVSRAQGSDILYSH